MAKIFVVGLGPGDLGGLPLDTYRRLQSGLPVFLRTEVHPVVQDLKSEGFNYSSFDSLYETGERFEEIYLQMAQSLFEAAQQQGDLVYAVPGHPLMAEQSVQNLLERAPNHPDIEVVVLGGQSFFDAVCTALKLDPIQGLCLLDGTVLTQDQLRTDMHLLIAQVFSQAVASEVKLSLMEVYPDDYPVVVVRAAGVANEEVIKPVLLYELDRVECIDHLTTVYVPKASERQVLQRDPWYVANLVKRLREPGGCPWDRKQTHQTLRPYVIEEAYEVASAIDEDQPEELAEELGDLLLQVLLNAQIASEYGEFQVRDVYAKLADKLVRRHPHVFGERSAASAEEAEERWQAAKQAENSNVHQEGVLDSIRKGQPAWKLALELQKKAAGVGFDWGDIRDVLAKVREELEELEAEIERGSKKTQETELGDVLFAVVNAVRWLDLDLETVLAQTNRKFEHRFRHVEQRVRERGGEWGAFSLEELDAFWNEAKAKEW